MLGAAVEAARRDGFRMPTRGVLLSLGPVTEKYAFYEEARALVDELDLPILATAVVFFEGYAKPKFFGPYRCRARPAVRGAMDRRPPSSPRRAQSRSRVGAEETR